MDMDGKALKAIRERLQLTQAQLGEKLGISSGAVSRIENGVHGLRGSTRILAEQLANHQ